MAKTELKIRFYGDPCLRKKAQNVDEVGPAERILIQSMIDTMHAFEGIGLAAPQVGISLRIFVVDVGDGPFAVIDPQVLKGENPTSLDEGCLSIPEVQIKVTRPEKIIVEYTNENNQRVQAELSGILAKVFQHESDHLDGKLIVDYASSEELAKYKAALEELEKESL